MTKPPRANLNKSDKRCPHCRGELEEYGPKDHGSPRQRCLSCKCRWNGLGGHFFVGIFCPLQYKLPITA